MVKIKSQAGWRKIEGKRRANKIKAIIPVNNPGGMVASFNRHYLWLVFKGGWPPSVPPWITACNEIIVKTCTPLVNKISSGRNILQGRRLKKSAKLLPSLLVYVWICATISSRKWRSNVKFVAEDRRERLDGEMKF